MQKPLLPKLAPILAIAGWTVWAAGAAPQFRHHFIARALPVSDRLIGDYGLTALADLDRDGDVDLASKPWGPRRWNGNGGQMHVDFLENLLRRR